MLESTPPVWWDYWQKIPATPPVEVAWPALAISQLEHKLDVLGTLCLQTGPIGPLLLPTGWPVDWPADRPADPLTLLTDYIRLKAERVNRPGDSRPLQLGLVAVSLLAAFAPPEILPPLLAQLFYNANQAGFDPTPFFEQVASAAVPTLAGQLRDFMVTANPENLRRQFGAELRGGPLDVQAFQPQLLPNLLLLNRDTITSWPGLLKLAFSPDAKRLIFTDNRGGFNLVELADPLSGQAVPAQHTGRINRLAFSPDGRYLASAGEDRTVVIWDGQAAHKLLHLKGFDNPVVSLAYSPDSRYLALLLQGGPLLLCSALNPHEFNLLTDLNNPRDLAFSPEGRYLYLTGAQPAIQVIEAASRQPVRTLDAPVVGLHRVVVSPDNRWLAGITENDQLLLWKLATGQLIARRDGCNQAAFRPDSRLLALAEPGGSLRLYNLADFQPFGPPLPGSNSAITDLAFSPAGSYLAAGSARDLRVYKLAGVS